MVDLLVQTDWLEAKLGDEGVSVLDASWYLPSAGRNARAEYDAAHISGAVFFDIDAVADPNTDLPHMLPSADEFAAAVSAMGIGPETHVVVYDGAGLFSAARVWWTFRAFGHDRVSVLDGGLPKWRSEGRALSADPVTPRPATFRAELHPELVRQIDQVRQDLDTRERTVLDARSQARFDAEAPEPRPGVRGGHMPGSLCVPFGELVVDGRLKSREQLRALFASLGLEPGQPITTSCGSGITASLLALGLARAGYEDVAVYDGSWAEWGGRPDTPIVSSGSGG